MTYTITEFRKNHRKALTEASQGRPILITRHDETFRLVLEKPLRDKEWRKVVNREINKGASK